MVWDEIRQCKWNVCNCYRQYWSHGKRTCYIYFGRVLLCMQKQWVALICTEFGRGEHTFEIHLSLLNFPFTAAGKIMSFELLLTIELFEVLVEWHSSRTSVCDRWTFHVLCSTCMWWVTTYVGKPFATRSGNSAFHHFEVNKWVVRCNRMCATSLGWGHLVNAYGVKAGWFIPFVDKRVGGR